MAYNPAGIFSLIATYFAEPGTTIRTEQHNAPLEDIAAGLSLTLVRDGRAPMTGPLNMNGFAINNVVAGNSPSSVATLAQAMPIGAVIDFAGSSAPAGWALCYGQAISRVTYAALFTLIGTTYGTGDGSTTFNLPDCRGCVVAGKDNMGGTAAGRLTSAGAVTGTTLGYIGGSQFHTLTSAQMPSHYHTASIYDPGHSHPYSYHNSVAAAVAGSFGIPFTPTTLSTGAAVTGVRINSSNGLDTTYSAGSGGSHNNVQPTTILNKIIRASYDA